MATYDRPTILPTWCADNAANVAQPPDSLRATGYVPNEVPVAEYENWWRNSVGQWLGYFDQANAATVMSTTLDFSLRLVGGGDWSYVAATKVLAWSAAAYLAVPGAPNADNTLAAGNAVLGDGQVAYVQANIPLTTTGATTSGSAQVTGIQMPSALAVGQTVTGAGIPSGATVVAISGGTLTLSAAATASNSAAALTFAGNQPLTLQVATLASFLPNPNTVVLAVGQDSSAIVGANSGQMLVRDGENKRLLGTGFVSVYRGVAGQALAALQPCYLSAGYNDGGRTTQALYPCDATAAGLRRAQFLGFTSAAAASGATAMLVTGGVLNGFSGLTPGLPYYLDPANVGGITSTAPTSSPNFVVPVGLALSSTQMRINAAGALQLTPLSDNLNVKGNLTVGGTSTLSGAASAPSFSSGGGFKTAVFLGNYCSTSSPTNTLVAVTQTFQDNNTSSSGYTYTFQVPVPMGTSGSVVGYTIVPVYYGNGTATFAPAINGKTLFTASVNTGYQQPTYVAVGKAASATAFNAFKRSDVLTASFLFSNSSNYFYVWAWVELDTSNA